MIVKIDKIMTVVMLMLITDKMTTVVMFMLITDKMMTQQW